jgi:1-deoxy-D-xylulose-5-phosphate synthase
MPEPQGCALPPTPLLDSLGGRAGLLALDAAGLEKLAAECRSVITASVAECGGHLASNLGAVELTVALHRAFDFSSDALVFDVGHQCYTHKLLTGRKAGFARLRKAGGALGFPNPAEHASDPFVVGHASTAISSALGLATADKLAGRSRRVVAVVGDGAATGGLAFEGLNQAKDLGVNVLVILNDNDMAISETVGALSGYLGRLRVDPRYREARDELSALVKSIPLVGKTAGGLGRLALNAARRTLVPGQLFEDLGWKYYGPVDGHNLAEMERELRTVSRVSGPVLLHVTTQKGQGYAPAAERPGAFHSAAPFYVENGRPRREDEGSWSRAAGEAMVALAEKRPEVVAVTAAMGLGTGLERFAERFPGRYFDVGICESHAAVFAGALAKGGALPVVAIYSTFLQRAYDQLFHDLAVQPGLGAVLAIDRAGLVGGDGVTHQGLYDISYLRPLPRTVLMAPRDVETLGRMFDFAANAKCIAAIRYPRAAAHARIDAAEPRPLEIGRGEVLRRGKRLAILAYGALVPEAVKAAESFAAGEVTVADARFAKPLDAELLAGLLSAHERVLVAEDGVEAGGLGSACLEACAARSLDARKLRLAAVPVGAEIGASSRAELLAQFRLDAAGLAERLR